MAGEKSNKNSSGTKNMTDCIVVKFHDDMNIQYNSDEGLMQYLSEHFKMPWASIIQKFPGIIFKRLIHSINADQLKELMSAAEHGANSLYHKTYAPPRFYNFFRIECLPGTAKEKLLLLIQDINGVEYAYIQRRSVPGAAPGTRRSFAYKQTYLNKAPLGIDAKFAWTKPGGKGGSAGLRFVHIENGWNPHSDLQNWAIAAPVNPLAGFNVGSKDHGTNVLGVITAQINGKGVNGITPDIDAAVVSQYDSVPPGKNENPANAICFAASILKPGDVMLITLQGYDEMVNMLPLEFEKAVFECIYLAVMKGIIVIEIAGNNGMDLAKHAVFDKNQPLHFKDSGAIIVAASKPARTHKRIPSSNFGTRVNCHAWGDKITTTDSNDGYKFDFGDTCGAAAIIAGAVISIQSMYIAAKNKTFNCEEMRNILSKPANGTSSPDPIGVMPDLEKVYQNFIIGNANP